MTRPFITFLTISTLITLTGCSTQKAKWANITYHNTTCHYNVWWNGNESFKEGIRRLGKTFADANIIAALNRPTLVLVHNKTLASQLYGEFKELFPENRVEYFVSNFDFYQPEAYVPKTDTYIDKNAVMNEEIEMLRTSTAGPLPDAGGAVQRRRIGTGAAHQRPAEGQLSGQAERQAVYGYD